MSNPFFGIRKKLFIDSELQDIVRYHQIIEDTLAKQAKEFDKTLLTLDDEEGDAFVDAHIDEIQNYSITFPNFHRKSLFLSIYSFMEYQLVKMCEYINDKQNIGLKYNELQGSTLQKIQKYLKYVVKMHFPETLEWRQIYDYSLIRNCIVHNIGTVNRKKDLKLLKIIEANQHIRINTNNNLIMIHKGYCEEFLKIVQVFLDDLIKQFNEFIRHHP
jgi:hypothetical protein